MTLSKLIRGQIPQRTLTRFYVPLIPGLFAALLLVTYLLEPPNPSYPYNWITSTISRLGWPGENVAGWIFFTLAFLCLGTLSLFLLPSYICKFACLRKRWVRLLSLFLLLACIGEIFLGAIPNFNTPDKVFSAIHLVNAFLYFFCLYGAAILIGILLAQRKSQWMASRKVAVAYAIVLGYGLFATILMIVFSPRGALGYYMFDPATPLLQSMPFWEWQSFFLALALILAPLYLRFKLPDAGMK